MIRLDRRRFVTDLMAAVHTALVVSGLGSASYDLFAAGHRPGNFYLWGAMGGATPLALGLALAQPERPVIALTGDGEQLMGIGALGTVAAARPANLTVVVLDNGHFGETDMQPSHTSLGTDLAAVARGFGITDAFQARQVADVTSRVLSARGPAFAHVLINADEPPRALPPRDGVAGKNSFRAALGLPTF
ncbi:thiamine pyrophosphate-dependent enzyme [Lentzea sp. HUAS12]|uniref:thiamine pyrophosphate-dependent enzyme n=1 Tax=Lentzea sp. HUAS12 TaxID=2951806 RepID=UPI0020A0854E|nr:thiamine pyrophosphate-dependent enzyme [Lentzea sp. HUAS12]USX53940.1 thiamine pyrophosphate-dependent enzyme [Lentzea sp. HUAS12]